MYANPSGSVMEVAVTAIAVAANAPSITVRGVVIYKYAPRSFAGAIGGANPSSGLTVEDCEIGYVFGSAIVADAFGTIRRNKIFQIG